AATQAIAGIAEQLQRQRVFGGSPFTPQTHPQRDPERAVGPHEEDERQAVYGLVLLAGKDPRQALDRHGERLGNHRIIDDEILTLTDFLGGEWRRGLTAAGGEAILGPQLGRVCNLPFASGLRRTTPCSASYACPL